jgi:hypothetical protein
MPTAPRESGPALSESYFKMMPLIPPRLKKRKSTPHCQHDKKNTKSLKKHQKTASLNVHVLVQEGTGQELVAAHCLR